MILPVNYSVVGESIVFRTTPDGVVANHDWDSPIAFDVDHVDYPTTRAGACWQLAPLNESRTPKS